ncbi:MAG TPA: hypothetical protein VK358_12230 [Longimicrobium sp.]|nr:hypothetical protein [Longimicrobium sp.]
MNSPLENREVRPRGLHGRRFGRTDAVSIEQPGSWQAAAMLVLIDERTPIRPSSSSVPG